MSHSGLSSTVSESGGEGLPTQGPIECYHWALFFAYIYTPHYLSLCGVVEFAPWLTGRLRQSSGANLDQMSFLPPPLTFLGTHDSMHARKSCILTTKPQPLPTRHLYLVYLVGWVGERTINSPIPIRVINRSPARVLFLSQWRSIHRLMRGSTVFRLYSLPFIYSQLIGDTLQSHFKIPF